MSVGRAIDSASPSNESELFLMLVKCAVCGFLFDESMWQCPECGAEAPLRKSVNGLFVALLARDAWREV